MLDILSDTIEVLKASKYLHKVLEMSTPECGPYLLLFRQKDSSLYVICYLWGDEFGRDEFTIFYDCDDEEMEEVWLKIYECVEPDVWKIEFIKRDELPNWVNLQEGDEK